MQVRLNDPIHWILNPLPVGCTAKLLLEKAEINIPLHVEDPSFDYPYQWGVGTELERIIIPAGMKKAFPSQVCRDISVGLGGDRGLVHLTEDDDEDVVALRGLHKALLFWFERGRKQIAKQKQVHGLPDEQLRFKCPHYYINAVKEDLIKQEIEKRNKAIKAKAKEAAA